MDGLVDFWPSVQVVLREARAAAQQQYLVLREALDQEEQTALQCVAKEENRVLGGLDEKLSHLRTSLQSVQQGLHILEGLADAKGDTRIQDQAFIVVGVILQDSRVGPLVNSYDTRLTPAQLHSFVLLLALQEYSKTAHL